MVVAGRTKLNLPVSSSGEAGRSADISVNVILVIATLDQTLRDRGYGEFDDPNPLIVLFRVLLARNDSLILAFLCKSAWNQSVPLGVTSKDFAPNIVPALSFTDKVVLLVTLLIILGLISSY